MQSKIIITFPGQITQVADNKIEVVGPIILGEVFTTEFCDQVLKGLPERTTQTILADAMDQVCLKAYLARATAIVEVK